MYDICIIGSGAGASPIAYELSKAGAKVLILERGDFYQKEDFSKDEIAYTKRSIVTPNLDEEYHMIEEYIDNKWQKYSSKDANWDFYNGNIVGGSSNFMSGFFHRLQPDDFRLYSKYGAIKNANISDWAISYDELLPYYNKVDKIVGVTTNTKEHPISKLFDQCAKELNLNPITTPRAILSKNIGERKACYYSNYCGSYGCSSGAKGSGREALLNPALTSGNLTIIANAFVKKLESKNKKVVSALYFDKKSKRDRRVKAKIFVLAAQAIESCRLLLNSKNSEYPNGLANSSNQVGKNLLFSAGGIISGEFDGTQNISLNKLKIEGLFVNRAIKDWYFLKKQKGGLIEALFEHANPIRKAASQKWDDNNKLVWGDKLYKKIDYKFNKSKQLDFEIFNDWLPNDNCFVSVDTKYKDIYGVNVAKIRIGSHPQNEVIGDILAQKSIKLLQQMGAKNISGSISPYPPQNLQAGGCRFGDDPKKSVLDKNCKAHDVKNLFVTDGSFMPTGGSVPYTYTIYANSFRVADYIKKYIK